MIALLILGAALATGARASGLRSEASTIVPLDVVPKTALAVARPAELPDPGVPPVSTVGRRTERAPLGTTPTTAPLTTAPLTTAPPTTASPTITPPTSASGLAPEQQGRTALGLIDYPWQSALPGWAITFHHGREGVLGLTHVERRTIEIFVRPGQSGTLLAHVVAHELGHAIDVTLNNADDRRRWQEARGIDASDWWPGEGATDFSTGAGDFAESFAAWQVGSANFRSNLAAPPTRDQMDLLADLLAD